MGRFPFRRLSYGSRMAVAAVFAAGLAGCNRVSANSSGPGLPSQREVDASRQEMEAIPTPSKNRYLAVRSLAEWQNPYLTVQENMVTLHVTLADPNPSDVGQGGLMRPVGARREDLNLAMEKLPEGVAAVPESSWPYGRVVAIEEAHNTPAGAQPAVRRTMETTIKLLGDMGVVVYEWQDGGPGLR